MTERLKKNIMSLIDRARRKRRNSVLGGGVHQRDGIRKRIRKQ